MKPLQIHYPFKYISVTRKWGVVPIDPDTGKPVYEQFGFKGHNGVDFICGYANQYELYAPKEWPIYCPVEGFTVHMKRSSPKGGGNEFWMLSDEPLQIGDKVCHAYLGFGHAKVVFAEIGDKPAVGQLLSIQDSTGFSTGAHLHFGMYRVNWDGKTMTFLDTNDANNSHDPALYLSGQYAVDLATLPTLIKGNLRYAKYFITGK